MKTLSRIGISIVCLVMFPAVISLVLGAWASGATALPGGYRPLVVASGSMRPNVPVGSVVFVKAVDPATIAAGDVITFFDRSFPGGQVGRLVTHRVVEVVPVANGVAFVTRGDANTAADAGVVPASRIVGRVVLVVPFLGHIIQFVHTIWVLVLMVLTPAAVLIGLEVLNLLRKRDTPLAATKSPRTKKAVWAK